MIVGENYLEHAGIVTDSQNGRIKIALTGSGCSACHKSLCMLGDSKAKEVEIPIKENRLRIGDTVIVKINPASGYKAVLLLYVLPFCLMILTLLSASGLGYHEGMAGLTSLLILVPYFSLLFLMKKWLSSQCTIDVETK
jgi:sigma-E factor negative regulatory protein RseC